VLVISNLCSSQAHELEEGLDSPFACWFQPGLISQPTVFSSHNKPAPVGLISSETNQRTGREPEKKSFCCIKSKTFHEQLYLH